MNKGFIQKPCFCYAFFSHKQPKDNLSLPERYGPIITRYISMRMAEAFYMKTEPIIGLANTKQKVKPEI